MTAIQCICLVQVRLQPDLLSVRAVAGEGQGAEGDIVGYRRVVAIWFGGVGLPLLGLRRQAFHHRGLRLDEEAKLGSQAGGVHGAVGDGLLDVEVAVANLDVEAARGVGAGPRLEVDGSALAAEVGQGHEVTDLALLALGEAGYHYH